MTLSLREHGHRVHFVHTLAELVAHITAYDGGVFPEERTLPVTDHAMLRANAQAADIQRSAALVIGAIKTHSETGIFSKGVQESIKRGMDIRCGSQPPVFFKGAA